MDDPDATQETTAGVHHTIATPQLPAAVSILAVETDGRLNHHARTAHRARRLHALPETVRAVRGAMPLGDPPGTPSGFEEVTAVMRLDEFAGITFTGLDGAPCLARELVTRRSVFILLDAHRTRAERTAAEVAWVVERLDPDIDLVLVWPRGTSRQAQGLPALATLRLVEDTTGAFRRLVSPTGRRIAVLVDPDDGTLHPLTAQSPLFDVGHASRDLNGRGTDRTVDLGDMHH
jgi:hypothetical protein